MSDDAGVHVICQYLPRLDSLPLTHIRYVMHIVTMACTTLVNVATMNASGMQVSVLDGNKYTTMCREAGEQCLEILEECKASHAL